LRRKMIQEYIKIQVLLFLATAMSISCSNTVRLTEVIVASGSDAVLPCATSPSNDHQSAVTWKRIIESEERTVWRRDKSGMEFRPVGQAPQVYCPHPNFQSSDFSLHIKDTKEEDAGMYRCEVGHRFFKNIILRVIKVSINPAVVFEGDQLTLSCSVTPQTSVTLVNWQLNGSQITSQNTFTINKVSQKDAGTWSCLIRNKSTDEKASILVQVKGILVPRDNSEVVYAELGSSVHLPCIFSDEILSNRVSWKKESKNQPALLPEFFNISYNPGVSQSSSVKGDRSAYIKSVQDGDEGTYKCLGQLMRANSKYVEVERTIQLVTTQVLSSYRNGKTFLTCHLSSTKQVTNYEWIYVEYGVNDLRTFTSVQNSTSKLLSVPKERHIREWVCRFYNQQQLLGNVTYHLPMMSAWEGEQQPTSGNKVVMIIGLCFLFLLLVLIVLQLYKNHRRRKMILQYPAMETIVHLASNEREYKERLEVREKTQNGACGKDLKSVSV
ncbi:B-cell receptor CD22-like, partial [Silurus asotus]